MKCNRFAIIALGLLCLGAFTASPALAQYSFVEREYAIVRAVDTSSKTVTLMGQDYVITAATEVLNDVGMPGNINDFEAMEFRNGVPDHDTGTKVYFEADYDHRLLKLHVVDEIPS